MSTWGPVDCFTGSHLRLEFSHGSSSEYLKGRYFLEWVRRFTHEVHSNGDSWLFQTRRLRVLCNCPCLGLMMDVSGWPITIFR